MKFQLRRDLTSTNSCPYSLPYHLIKLFDPVAMVYVVHQTRMRSNLNDHPVYFGRFFGLFPKMHLQHELHFTVGKKWENIDFQFQKPETTSEKVNQLKNTYVIALVSANIKPCSSANSFASSYVTSRVLLKSDLLPIKNITVFGFVKFFVSVNQLLKWLYVVRRVISYTINAPAAPLQYDRVTALKRS